MFGLRCKWIFFYSVFFFVCQGLEEPIFTNDAQLDIFDRCGLFLAPIIKRHLSCMKTTSNTTVDVCLSFSTDVEFLIPFIVHYLGLGAYRVIIYNNDESLAWYRHPTITCLVSSQMLVIQPWPGEGAGLQAYDHCFFKIIEGNRKVSSLNSWGAVFDVDEFLVLHNGQKCINSFVASREVPGLMVGWASYFPTFPLEGYGLTSRLIGNGSEASGMYGDSALVIPHELLTMRSHRSSTSKTIARVGCVKNWVDPHFPNFRVDCPYGDKLLELYKESTLEVAQVNHYWTLSLKHFLRKMHRGPGSEKDRPSHEHRNRSTVQLFAHIKGARISDRSFLTYYGDYFAKLKLVCLQCFNITHYYSANSLP
jgi:hypothetical protein